MLLFEELQQNIHDTIHTNNQSNLNLISFVDLKSWTWRYQLLGDLVIGEHGFAPNVTVVNITCHSCDSG